MSTVSGTTADGNGGTDDCVGQAPATGAIAQQFGAANVASAYCEMVEFTLNDSSFVPNLLVPKPNGQRREPADFTFVEKYMTPRLQQAWEQQVAASLKGDSTASQQVNTLTFYDLSGPDLTVTDRPDLVVNKKAGPATPTADANGPGGEARLGMTFPVSATINVMHDGAPYALAVTKNMTYWLLPSGQSDRPWTIDAYSGTYTLK